jgi:hypothetical protein
MFDGIRHRGTREKDIACNCGILFFMLAVKNIQVNLTVFNLCLAQYRKYTHFLYIHSLRFDISRSLIRIFEVFLEYTSARSKKYSSKLDISRSLIRIFAVVKYIN